MKSFTQLLLQDDYPLGLLVSIIHLPVTIRLLKLISKSICRNFAMNFNYGGYIMI